MSHFNENVVLRCSACHREWDIQDHYSADVCPECYEKEHTVFWQTYGRGRYMDDPAEFGRAWKAHLDAWQEALQTIRTFKVGDKVFDIPSQRVCTVIGVNIEFDAGEWLVFYTVDAPNDPTGDGAFPDGGRNDYEVCEPDKTLPLDY